MTIHVIAMPGGVNPAEVRYGPVQAVLGDDIKLHWKDLEVYAGDEPPAGYSTQMEVNALSRFADSLGLERFHLLGYSGGGFISLAFAGAHPDRLRSLALFEPASIPGPFSHAERVFWDGLVDGLRGADGDEFMRGFITLQVRPGVDVQPPQGPPPPWMAKRPAGLKALMAAFPVHLFDRDSLRRVHAPTFVGHGSLTGEQEEIRAGVLARLMPDIHVRRFEGIHHFVPADKLYTPEHLQELRNLWTKSDAAT
jgi:pimeloyl-ACP methyl ester carboxylesterase